MIKRTTMVIDGRRYYKKKIVYRVYHDFNLVAFKSTYIRSSSGWNHWFFKVTVSKNFMFLIFWFLPRRNKRGKMHTFNITKLIWKIEPKYVIVFYLVSAIRYSLKYWFDDTLSSKTLHADKSVGVMYIIIFSIVFILS